MGEMSVKNDTSCLNYSLVHLPTEPMQSLELSISWTQVHIKDKKQFRLVFTLEEVN